MKQKASNEAQLLHQEKFLSLYTKNGWEYVSRRRSEGVVMIVGITNNDEVVLIEQFRIPVNSKVLEFPAGLVGDSEEFKQEAFIDAARREFLEETGYEAAQFQLMSKGPTSPGLSSEIIAIFVARDLKKVQAGGGDATEDISIHLIPITQLKTWLYDYEAQGGLIDPKVFAGIYFLENYKKSAPPLGL